MCDDANILESFLASSEMTRLICEMQLSLAFFIVGGMVMADSNITKRALSEALKELMEEKPFEKISVADICEKCNMNRKSFYYHFRDKHDLVNWIFDTEFNVLIDEHNDDQWELIEVACRYFYENKKFYRRILKVTGQNSFSEHFRECMLPLLHNRIQEIVGSSDVPPMCIDILADGICCAFARWLLDRDGMKPEEFISVIRQMLQIVAAYDKEAEEQP